MCRSPLANNKTPGKSSLFKKFPGNAPYKEIETPF
jgi:hypothetical protein